MKGGYAAQGNGQSSGAGGGGSNCELNTLLNKVDDAGMIALWAILATMLPGEASGIIEKIIREETSALQKAVETLHRMAEYPGLNKMEDNRKTCGAAVEILELALAYR